VNLDVYGILTFYLKKKKLIHISERVLVFIFMAFFRASSVAGSGASDTDAPHNNVQGVVKWAQQIVLLKVKQSHYRPG